MTVSDPGAAFRDLAKAVAERVCVPFLGAGISLGATWPTKNDTVPKNAHDCKFMQQTLAEELRRTDPRTAAIYDEQCLPSQDKKAFDEAITHCPPGDVQKNLSWHTSVERRHRLSDLCELLVAGKDLAEAFRKLVGLLHIHRWIDLQPTPAHRILAWLAREGLISEVMTSNYDCCLERAFLQASGISAPEIESFCARPDPHDLIRIVWDSATHAAHGAVPIEVGHSGLRRLIVVKANGCAREAALAFASAPSTTALSLAEQNRRIQSVILTGIQLQDWRDRHWVRDLFRNHLRTSRVAFSGFGSDEPQVVHTLHQVLEEWQTTVGKERKWPLFCSYQLPVPVHISHLCAAVARARGLPLEDVDVVVGPTQAHHSGILHTDLSMSADDCWFGVYAFCFRHSLRQHLNHGTVANRLNALTTMSPAFLTALESVFALADEREPPHANLMAWLKIPAHAWEAEKASDRWKDFPSDAVPPWANVTAALLGDNSPGFYPALCDHAGLWCELLLIQWLLTGSASEQDVTPWHDPKHFIVHAGGMRLDLGDGYWVLITADPDWPKGGHSGNHHGLRAVIRLAMVRPSVWIRPLPMADAPTPLAGGVAVPCLTFGDLLRQLPTSLKAPRRSAAAQALRSLLLVGHSEMMSVGRDWRSTLFTPSTS